MQSNMPPVHMIPLEIVANYKDKSFHFHTNLCNLDNLNISAKYSSKSIQRFIRIFSLMY